MHRLKVMLALLLLASCGVPLAGAAGVGTFSIEQTTPNVGVGQFGIATLYMDNTWEPPADSVILHVGWDPALLEFVSADWKVGNSVSATLNSPGDLTMSFADWANKYPSGRVPIADINFRGVQAGQVTMGIRIDSVRSHVGVSPTDFTELTQSSLSNPGIFTVGQGGGTVVPTVPVGPTGTVTPTVTGTVMPTLTVEPTVTGTVMPTLTVEPTVTGTVMPTLTPVATVTPIVTVTGITTGVPFVPSNGLTSGSEDYTGVVTRTATVTPTATGTVTGTATVTPGATPTDGADGEQTIVQVAQADPNLSTLVTAVQEAGLVETLSGPGPFTVFAPTNEAFDALPPGTLDALLQDREQLTSVLTYHVASGRFMAADVTGMPSIATVQGTPLTVNATDGRVMVDGANVTQTDIQASNGVIHLIDAVMLPPAGNVTPGVTPTATVITTVPGDTTPGVTTVPVNTTATAAGADVLPLAVVGLAALALFAARRR
jgi:uncharacterized surface protein with fasciclin (FAS1) repeats